ncbi:MAG: hypothetical protein V5A55_04170 [Halovenus sp.]
MDRRQFLKVSGAFASIEFHRDAITERVDDRTSPEHSTDLTAFVQRLPSMNGLNADSHLAFSLTRLDENAATLTESFISDATAYATVFAGRTATDVAFGLEDTSAVRTRLTADGYEKVRTYDGRPVFHRRTRTRHRVIAVTDSTAIIGVGPVFDAVQNDVTETLAAVRDPPTVQMADTELCQTILDHLGSGTHLSVDMTPDSRRTTAHVEATGEHYQFHGDTTVVRTVTLFDTPVHARAASQDDLESPPTPQYPAAGDCSTDCQGRAVVRETRLPSAAVPSGSYRRTE